MIASKTTDPSVPTPKYVMLRVAFSAVLAKVEQALGMPAHLLRGCSVLSFDPTSAHYAPDDSDLLAVLERHPLTVMRNFPSSVGANADARQLSDSRLDDAVRRTHLWLMERLSRGEVSAKAIRVSGHPDDREPMDDDEIVVLNQAQWLGQLVEDVNGEPKRLYCLPDYRGSRYFIQSMMDPSKLFEAEWWSDICLNFEELTTALRNFDTRTDGKISGELLVRLEGRDTKAYNVSHIGNMWLINFDGLEIKIPSKNKKSAILIAVLGNANRKISYTQLDRAAQKIHNKPDLLMNILSLHDEEELNSEPIDDCKISKIKYNLLKQFKNILNDIRHDGYDRFADHLMNSNRIGHVSWNNDQYCEYIPGLVEWKFE